MKKSNIIKTLLLKLVNDFSLILKKDEIGYLCIFECSDFEYTKEFHNLIKAFVKDVGKSSYNNNFISFNSFDIKTQEYCYNETSLIESVLSYSYEEMLRKTGGKIKLIIYPIGYFYNLRLFKTNNDCIEYFKLACDIYFMHESNSNRYKNLIIYIEEDNQILDFNDSNNKTVNKINNAMNACIEFFKNKIELKNKYLDSLFI